MDMYINQTHNKSSIAGPSKNSPPRPEQKRYHRQSSSQTVISNASSKRSHRRSYVEVGSMIFGPSPAPSPGIHGTIPMTRQNSEPIKRSSMIHRSFSPTEHRAPDDDSKESSYAPVRRAPSSSDRTSWFSISKVDSETICCTASKEDDETTRALELIKKLSFETGDVSSPNALKKSHDSVCSAPTILATPMFSTPAAARRYRQPQAEADRPESPTLVLPLPPKIQRMEDSHSVVSLPDHVPQLMHNRNRLRSTSLSEMSDSCRLAFGPKDEDEDGSCSNKSNEDELVLSTIEHATSPPLHPTPRKPRTPPLLNRGRTTTMSDHSSFLSSSSSSSKDDSEYSISSYEDELRGLDDPPGYYEGDFKSEPWQHDSVRSFQDAHRTYASWDHNAAATSPRLSCEALKEWNRYCEEQEFHTGVVTKHEHILRALSCPDITAMVNNDHVSDEKVQDVPKHLMMPQTSSEGSEERDLSPEVVPHLMASDLPMSHAPSRSIFSYTNSYSPSTISSGLSDHMDEISHLDFDITFLYPREIEVVKNSPNTIETVALQKKHSHRRSRSSMGLSKPLNPKKNLATNRRHRRNKSDIIPITQDLDGDATLPTQKHRKMLSLTNIIEDVKSQCSADDNSNDQNIKSMSSSGANSSDRNLLNILSLSQGSDETNASSIKGMMRLWGMHGEKIYWFTVGCCFTVTMQYLLRL